MQVRENPAPAVNNFIKKEVEGNRMKMKRLMGAVITLTMLLVSIMGNTVAASETNEWWMATKIYICEDNVDYTIVPGETKHMKIPVRTTDMYMDNLTLHLEAEAGAPFRMTEPKLTRKDTSGTVDRITSGVTTYVEFDVITKDTADIGVYKVKLTVYSRNGDSSYSRDLSFELRVLEEKDPAQLAVDNVRYKDAVIGRNGELSFLVVNEGEIKALNTYVSIDYSGTKILPKYTTEAVKVGNLEGGKSQLVTLPITILPEETEGNKTLKVTMSYKDDEGKEYTNSRNIYIKVEKNASGPSIAIEKISYKGTLKPGNDVTVVATIMNIGLSTAKDLEVKVKDDSLGATAGIIKNYLENTIFVGEVDPEATKKVEIPLTILKNAQGGVKELVLEFTCTDETDTKYTNTISIYPDIIGDSTDEKKSNLVVSNVKQSVAQPMAGERLEVSFDIENKGEADVKELKVMLENLTGTTFIPLNLEPYQYIGTLEGGKKVSVRIPFELSESIPEGLNNLSVKLSYTGGEQAITLPVRDVQNDAGSSKIPKLIVSKYYADVEELRAGKVFNFTFDLHNTNSSVAAKNITVTVSQQDNIFTVTQGSNSFFINKMDPGETVSNVLELKIKSDASTKAYPLKIVVEYEYDGAEPNPETGEIGLTRNYELNLQVVENSRPVVDYVNVYSWDGNIMVDNPATLSFEFYNMGKSPLNNVIAIVEGDFVKSDGNMYFIGNVAEGGSSYVEFEVLPKAEGLAKGILKITFEDSNGDEIEFTKEFEATVNGAQIFDPGMMDPGVGEVFNPMDQATKKPILPVWAFVIIQIVIFVIFVPVTRKVIINVYKAKLRKKDQEQY